MGSCPWNGLLQQVRIGAIDPAPISTEWVAVVKGIGLALVLIGFVTSLKKVFVEE